MDTSGSHRYRLDDFDYRPRVASWEALPPVAANIRWLKLRLTDLLPAKLTLKYQMDYRLAWDELVDSEAQTWRYGNSPHGWYSWQPDGYELPQTAMEAAVASRDVVQEDHDEPWDVIGVPSATRTEVMTASTWLDHLEAQMRNASTKIPTFELGSCVFEVPELPGFLAVIAAHCLQDAELSLIRGGGESSAWHSVAEATELINRAERIRNLVIAPTPVRTIEVRQGRFYVGEDNFVVVELLGECYTAQRKKNARDGFRCIQALLKEQLHSIPSETLAVEYGGYEPVDDDGTSREPLIEFEEKDERVKRLKVIEEQKSQLDCDADDYEERFSELEEEQRFIARDLSNRTHRGRPKLSLGPKQRQQRQLGAVIERSLKRIEEMAPGIGTHFRESLHGLHGERLSYQPNEEVEWCFDAPQ